jgi:diguanylate cyclase (GGDEF)-like protein
MKEKTILIVDDTVTNLDILADLLHNFDVIDALSGKDALQIVNEEKIDLILLDIMMPEMDGYDVCKKLKENPKTKKIPVIFITAITDESNLEYAYDLGASDYITKPFKPKELLAKVKRELHIQELIHSLEVSKKELELLAATDPLTKLYNRRYFTESSNQIFNLCKRLKEEISVIIMDIDNFKSINDTYGHNIGDDVIIDIANKLVQNQRKSDVACRFGGEEFVLLLPNTKKESALVIAEKIRKNVESSIIHLTNNSLQYTISIGISNVHFKDETNIEKALKRADEALYIAKNNGKNQVQVSSE